MLARQIRNLPVEEAIRQMEFSDKRSAKKILHNLAFARKNAQDQKGMEKMVVCK
jgi:ribosomal protein L22